MSFHFDPKTHTYTLDGKKMTGVTTVLGVINKPALVGWAANQAVDYVYEHMVHADGDTPVQSSYAELIEVLEDARKAHIRKRDKRGVEGTDVHQLVEDWVNACIESFDGMATAPQGRTSLPHQRFIDWAVENEVQFLESEKVMYHPEWFVGGTADFVCIVDGKKYVGDIKTQKKIYDRVPFFQMAAYRAMLESMGEEDIHGSLIVHLPMGGELETHYSFDYQTDLDGFLSALKLYRLLNNY